MVVLPDGDRLMRVTLGIVDGDGLEVQSDALGKLSVPLDCLLGWIMVVPADSRRRSTRCGTAFASSRARTKSSGSRTATGSPAAFLGWTTGRSRSRSTASRVEIDRAGIVAVGFDPALVNYPRPKSGFLELTLQGRHAAWASATPGSTRATSLATTRFGQKIRFPLSELVGVHVRSPSIVYLSERKPVQARYYSLRRADPRISRRSDGRRPSVPAGRPDFRPRDRHAEPHLAGLPDRTGRSAVSGARRSRRAGRAARAASSFACWSTRRNDSRARR